MNLYMFCAEVLASTHPIHGSRSHHAFWIPYGSDPKRPKCETQIRPTSKIVAPPIVLILNPHILFFLRITFFANSHTVTLTGVFFGKEFLHHFLLVHTDR
jgi:hypothetical protein